MSKIGYLGPKASFTHQAALAAFEGCERNLQVCETITDVFKAVQSGDVEYGVVPIENSTNGAVTTSLDAFATSICGSLDGNQFSDILVCREVSLRIRHFLLASRTEEHDRSLARIKRVYTHPQAWGQCRKFLDSHLSHAERVSTTSTSHAAELAAQDPTGETAAISSEFAAKVYDLDILRPGIQTSNSNVTRFFVLKRGGDTLTRNDATTNAINGTSAEAKHTFKSLILFTVAHTSPGDLAHCLLAFEHHKLNLTSIHHRPRGEIRPDDAIFIEILGKREGDGSGPVNEALTELGTRAKDWRFLGHWSVPT